MQKPTLASLQKEVDAIKLRNQRVEKPLINAIVPTLGFLLSTMSLPFIKKWWQDQ